MKVIKCKQCGIEIKGGFYNTPNGVFCPDCWEKKPKEVKDKALSDVLKGMAMLGKMVSE
ncbi:hypothetical protein [Bacteroides cellulosilyticus]|jgi:hypothetical protein|uniref:hypothetical protein n=1 Tax=Bacteroides cellulosilyticus TaxID=246787 RepID=UPI00189DA42C|nr:hypothetical protein [Bacteroides cellulosilyticus]DAU32347.1 MAG TPA: DNA-directed RNA polymerase [Caudoviricetes sp.]